MNTSADIKILIVEDELIIAEDIKTKLLNLGYFVTDIVSTYDEAIHSIRKCTPDIIILDIMLGREKDGVDLAKTIRAEYQIPFIFLTSYADKVTVDRAKQVLPDGYLLKPFTDKELFASIEVALFKKQAENQTSEKITDEEANAVLNNFIYIKKDYRIVKISCNDLLWIKSDGNYLEIHSKDVRKYLIRSTLKDFLKKLPVNLFLQTHKSFAVNTSYIEAVGHRHLIVNHQKIPIGRLFAESVREALKNKDEPEI